MHVCVGGRHPIPTQAHVRFERRERRCGRPRLKTSAPVTYRKVEKRKSVVVSSHATLLARADGTTGAYLAP
jgi:hypothetical protein